MNKVIKLVKIDPLKNINNFYEIYENNDRTFTVRFGRIESPKNPRTKIYLMSELDRVLNRMLKKGYKIIYTQDDIDIDIDNININESLSELKRQIVIDYRISPENLSFKQINMAENILNNIENIIITKKVITNLTKNDFDKINELLLEIYTILPRRMDDVSKYLINTISNIYYSDILDLKRLLFNERRLIDKVKEQKKIISKINKLESMLSKST